MTKNSLVAQMAFWLIATLYLLYYLIGWGSFSIWDQILDLRGVSLNQLNIFIDAHYLRFALMIPIFYLADFLNIEPNQVFTDVVTLMGIATAINIAYVANLNTANKNHLNNYKVLSILLMMCLSSIMDGRMMFSLFGMSLLITAITQWENNIAGNIKLLLYAILSFWLNSVSTGAFTVAVTLFYLWLFTTKCPRKTTVLKLTSICLLILLSPLLILYTLKNINFFDGGVEGAINMLQHGFGIIFYNLDPFLIFEPLIMLIILAITAFYFYLKLLPFRTLLLAVYTSAAGGLFGFSTFATGAPAFFILLLLGSSFLLKAETMPNIFRQNSDKTRP